MKIFYKIPGGVTRGALAWPPQTYEMVAVYTVIVGAGFIPTRGFETGEHEVRPHEAQPPSQPNFTNFQGIGDIRSDLP